MYFAFYWPRFYPWLPGVSGRRDQQGTSDGGAPPGAGVPFRECFPYQFTEEQAAATPDIHHPLFDLSDHDRELLVQIRELASQLDHTASIDELIEMRGRIIRGLNQG